MKLCAAARVGVCLVLLTLAGLSPSHLMAQTASTGALTGTVTDSSGAVVPNVTVTVTSADTAQVRTTTTSGDGSYKVDLLSPGNYMVRFEASGFQRVELPSVTVTVTETGTLNQVLTVGAQTQEVTVQANVETVQTSNAATGTTLQSQTIQDIPLSTRNYTNLLAFSAGANASVNNANGLGKGNTTIAVNGSNTAQNNYQMDGVTAMGSMSFGTLGENGSYAAIAVPNPDAIQEFKIQTSLYDASFGRNPGANVNVVTKSGTNQFHGTGLEFFRNTVLNANDFFNKNSEFRAGQPNKPGIFNSNQFGGTFGGPVKKDKLFFFASYQETQQKNGNASFGVSSVVLPAIPAGDRSTPAFKAALGHDICSNLKLGSFGQRQDIANTAFNPNAISGAQVGCSGANVNPVALALLNLKLSNGSYYIPSSGLVDSSGNLLAGAANAGYIQGFFIRDPAIYKEHQLIGNWDWVLSPKNTLSGKYFYSTDPTLAPFGTGSTSTTPGTGLLGGPLQTTFTYDNATLKLTSVLTNNLVNELRGTYELFKANDKPLIPFTDQQAGIQPLVSGIDQLAAITVTGDFSLGTQQIQYQTVEPSQYIAADTVSWSHGKQTIRFGFEAERDDTNWLFPGLSVVAETFPDFADFVLGLPGCASPGAACTATQNNGTGLTGTTGLNLGSMSSSGNVTSNGAPGGIYHNYRVTAFDSFFEDDIKLTPRFTLNMGLRWEYDGAITDARGRLTNLWPSLAELVPIPGTTPCTGTLAGFVVPENYTFPLTQFYPANYSPNGVTFPCGAGNAASTVKGVTVNKYNQPGEKPIPLDDFAPRLGFAWQPLQSNRFAIRGGAGYFYDRLPLGTIAMGVEQAPPYSNTIGQSGSNNFFATESTPYAAVPLGWTPRYVNPNPGVGELPTSSIANPIYPPGFTVPVVYEWNLTTQYEFAPKWVLELGYVGSHGIHQQISHSINTPELIRSASGINCGLPPSAAQSINASGCVSTVTAGNLNFRVPLLGVAPSQSETDTNGNTKFNSLQVTVRRQFSHGLTFQAAYTWSRAFITTYGSLNTDNPYANIYGLNTNYRPQRLVVNYSWLIPTGHVQGLLGKFTNGWTFSGVTTVQDGTPLTFTNLGGTGFLGNGATSGRAEFCSGANASELLTHGSVEQRLGAPAGETQAYFIPPTTPGVICPAPTLASLGFPNTDGVATGFGNSGIGVLLGPGQFNWDMSLGKNTVVGGLREDATLDFRVELFNTFNHPQFANPVVTANAVATFGTIGSTTVNPRLMQLALKYTF